MGDFGRFFAAEFRSICGPWRIRPYDFFYVVHWPMAIVVGPLPNGLPFHGLQMRITNHLLTGMIFPLRIIEPSNGRVNEPVLRRDPQNDANFEGSGCLGGVEKHQHILP